MGINPTNISKTNSSNITDIKKEKFVSENNVDNSENFKEAVYPEVTTMRAYSNIKPQSTVVSRQDALDFIHSTGCKYEARCEDFLKNLTDSDGYIKQETFDWAKNCYEKSNNLFLAMNLIEHSKENGKINHNMLEVLEPAMSEIKKSGVYSISGYFDIPKFFKDKNGKFNNDLLNITKDFVQKNPKSILIRPEYLSSPYMTSDKEFDLDAIEYHKSECNNLEYKEIKENIYKGKDKNGVFSKERMEAYKDLEKHLEKWQVNKALNLADQVKDKKAFLDFAKTMKDDNDLSEIFDIIENTRKIENNKVALEFDKKSVEFIRQLKNSLYFSSEIIPEILNKINIPYSDFSNEDISTLINTLKTVRESTEIEPLLDASIYKAGDKKGQFSFENLQKYTDIYNSNLKSIKEVNYISGILSLETDDKALDTIHKLYNLKWETESQSGYKIENRLNRGELHFIFDLSTLSEDGVPKRKFLPNILANFNNLMKMKLPMQSAEAFENFMTFDDRDIIERLEKIRLDEIGVKTGQMTQGKFRWASEDELFAFKDYMLDFTKDKDKKAIDINLNTNISDVIEVKYNNTTVLFDMAKKRPTAERTIKKGLYNVSKELKDYEKNITVKQLFRRKYEDFDEHLSLIDQTVEKYDKSGKLEYTETMKKSDIEGVFNVQKTYPDGRIEDIVKAQKLPNGSVLIEKNLTSADGVKTYFKYEDDVTGNRIMDYRIVDTDGKKLMNQSSTFEVIDENHFVSSRNNKSYDIKFEEDTVRVKNLQTGKIAEINLVEFTNSTQKEIIPLLKKNTG